MSGRMTVLAFLLVLLIPAPISFAEPLRDPGAALDVPLKNWIPALAAHPPAVEEGQVAATALPSVASHFIALTPCRVVDTRRPDGAHGGPILTGSVSRAFNVPAGPCPGIPAAAAYSLNIAVTGSVPGSGQFLTAYPAGTTRPNIATMNFDGGKTVSNAALVPADGVGSIEIYISTNSHVILDINGYIREGVVTSVTPGAGLTGGGTGAVSVGIADGGIGASQLGASVVTTGAIADAAVTGAKISNGQVVRSLEGLTDAIDLIGAGGNTVTAAGSSITISAAGVVPPGTIILGSPNDTTLISAGYSELNPHHSEFWTATSTDGAPVARRYHTAVWTGTKMIVWGGSETGVTSMNTGSQYDPTSDSWSATTTTDAPTERSSHTAVWTGTNMIIWGGSSQNTGGKYEPVTDSWVSTNTTDAPAARAYHTAIWTGTEMIVWGGISAGIYVDSGGRYDPAANLWTATNTTGAPSARDRHTAIWTGTTMIVWGGFDGIYLDTGGQYDLSDNSWSATSASGMPAARYLHTAVWTGTKMIVWGGVSSTLLNTGGRYDPSANSWSPTNTADAPAARYGHTALWTGTKMIVWGSNGLNTGGLYDATTDSWRALTTADAPSGRDFHAAVWTGTAMIVWGGEDGASLETGGRWTPLSLYRRN